MKIRFFEAVFSPLFKIRYHYKNDNTVNDNTACLAKLWILLDLKLYQLIIKFWLINLTGVRKIETISSKIHQEKIMAIVRDFFSFLAQICKVWFCSTFILSFFFIKWRSNFCIDWYATWYESTSKLSVSKK